jgi:hypothetical protein
MCAAIFWATLSFCRTAIQSFALVTEEEALKGAYKAKIESFDSETFMKLSSLDFTRLLHLALIISCLERCFEKACSTGRLMSWVLHLERLQP